MYPRKYDTWFEEVMDRGLTQGRTEGREQGREQGREEADERSLQAWRARLKADAAKRFGVLPVELIRRIDESDEQAVAGMYSKLLLATGPGQLM